MRKRYLVLSLFLLFSCKTSDPVSATTSSTLTEPVSLSAPFASGQDEGVSWQLRLNRAQCQHAGFPSTYCKDGDRERVIQESGIEDSLLSWIKDPKVKSVRFSYMTFGSSRIANALCDEATTRALEVEVYLQAQYVFPPEKAEGAYKKLVECSQVIPTFKVYPRGSKGWLNHAKIFLAQGDDFVRMTSSSANLSGSGISLHYDNWLLLETASTHPLALANLCFFQGLKDMGSADGTQDKSRLQKTQQGCLQGLAQSDAFRFIAVPAPQNGISPLETLIALIEGARDSITIAAHKITDTQNKKFPLVDALVAAIARGVKIRIVFDDDTILKHKKLPGWEGLNVSADELRGFQRLVDAGADIHFVDTNESIMALMHNKFMILDGSTIFTGAGNFSAASLTGKNTEQFYIIKVPAIIAAYQKGWEELYAWGYDAAHFEPGPDAPVAGTPPLAPPAAEPLSDAEGSEADTPAEE